MKYFIIGGLGVDLSVKSGLFTLVAAESDSYEVLNICINSAGEISSINRLFKPVEKRIPGIPLFRTICLDELKTGYGRPDITAVELLQLQTAMRFIHCLDLTEKFSSQVKNGIILSKSRFTANIAHRSVNSKGGIQYTVRRVKASEDDGRLDDSRRTLIYKVYFEKGELPAVDITESKRFSSLEFQNMYSEIEIIKGFESVWRNQRFFLKLKAAAIKTQSSPSKPRLHN